MKAMLFSLVLGLALALWGADPLVGIDHVMTAGKIAGEAVYAMLR